MDQFPLVAILFVIFVFCFLFRINPVEFVVSFFRRQQLGRDSKDALRIATIEEESKASRATDLLNRVFDLEQAFAYIRLELPEPVGLTITEELERIKLAAVRTQQDFERVQSLGGPKRKKLSTNQLLIQRISYEGVNTQVKTLTEEMDELSSQFKSLTDHQSQPKLPETTGADKAQERSSL